MRFAGILALVLVSACSETERDPSQWPIARSELESAASTSDPGEAAYRRTCIGCHMRDGRGNGGTIAADLTRADGLLAVSDDAVRGVILDGRRGSIGVMPPHRALLSAAEVDAVIAYVRREIAPNVHPVPDAGVASDASSVAP